MLEWIYLIVKPAVIWNKINSEKTVTINRYIFILLCLFFLSTLGLNAQKSCLNTLREAKELYEGGLIDEIPELLSGCMETGFTRAQRIEAYKLIILAYIFDDDQFEAEKMMNEFLKKFPEYEVVPNDPVEFVYLLESYKTASFYSINLFAGPNFSNPRITEMYSTLDQTQSEFSDKMGSGFHVGLGVSRNLWKSININFDFIYSWQSFKLTEKSNVQIENRINPANFTEIIIEEKFKKIDLPLTFTYGFGKGNLNYFLRLGGMVSFMVENTLSPQRTQYGTEAISESETDISKQREQVSFAVLGGFGLEYKVPRGFIILDVRYHVGLNNMVKEDSRYEFPRFWSRYFYVDNNYMLDHLSVSIGYYFSIYQSKKNRF